MSRSQCSKCGEVYSTTADPNGIEGYFLTDELWDYMDGDDKWNHVKKNENFIRCEKCPKCGHIFRSTEKYKKKIKDRVIDLLYYLGLIK